MCDFIGVKIPNESNDKQEENINTVQFDSVNEIVNYNQNGLVDK